MVMVVLLWILGCIAFPGFWLEIGLRECMLDYTRVGEALWEAVDITNLDLCYCTCYELKSNASY